MRLSFLCTAKLRKELGIKDKDLSEVDSNIGLLSHWYADLIRIGSRKSVIFVHPETRYTLVALDRKRPEIKELSELFRDLFQQVFIAEGVGELLIAEILGASEEAPILKTVNKSVIGTMTDMVRTIRWEFDYPDEVVREKEVALSLKLSDTPIGSLGFHIPYQKMLELLRDHYGFTGRFARKGGISSSISVPIQEENSLPDSVSNLRVERLWRSIPKEMQKRVLHNVWCSECRTSREMIDFKLLVRQDMVVLEGKCAACQCVLAIEED
ncbi:MAG: hypothetical protein KDD60_06580 [Bdellovibrionales bacterium]|nr:hypothetical protein [Bdellovibrionales bacterium]